MPPVTLILVALNLATYCLEMALGGMPVCETWGLTPAHPTLATALSSMWLHDPGSLFHLGGNLVFLAVFGSIVEKALGASRFTGLYLAAGLAGAALHVLVDPSSTSPLVGASGALFGLLAMAAVLNLRTLGFAVAFVGIEIWHAFSGGSGTVSFACHIGGFFAGFVAVVVMREVRSEALEVA